MRYENENLDGNLRKYCLTLQIFSDPASEASSARDAFYPEPREHGVYLPVRPGGVRHQDPQPGRRAAQPRPGLRVLPVRHGLHPHLEMGQSSQR